LLFTDVSVWFGQKKITTPSPQSESVAIDSKVGKMADRQNFGHSFSVLLRNDWGAVGYSASGSSSPVPYGLATARPRQYFAVASACGLTLQAPPPFDCRKRFSNASQPFSMPTDLKMVKTIVASMPCLLFPRLKPWATATRKKFHIAHGFNRGYANDR